MNRIWKPLLLVSLLGAAAAGPCGPAAARTQGVDAVRSGGDRVVLAQANVPLPRPRPLQSEPPTAVPLQGDGMPADLLQGLDIDPDSAFGSAAADLIRPDRELHLAARLADEAQMLGDGLIWRIYRAQPALDGSFELVEESEAPAPIFTLPADDYIVHVAYGLANTASRVSLSDADAQQTLDLNAGGLRLAAIGVLDEPIPERQVSVSVYSSEQDEYGQRKLLVEDAAPGRVIRLNAGTYHVVSRFGDANSVMRADIRVKPGELTDATIRHRAAEVTLKLVNEPGGEALANTAWSILSPGGDVVKESYGAFPTHVLAAGDYSVVARHDGQLYNHDFNVAPGLNSEVEIIAQ